MTSNHQTPLRQQRCDIDGAGHAPASGTVIDAFDRFAGAAADPGAMSRRMGAC